ncbi:uncharacterized protein LOC124457709 [Xenia sp. Carnegie-2017]|uniref:uncharacterized protein LOC124457709 n=1 Tax=Xenia sp. Carnegie-2017 TaxID=2897299 RepID=UPI001F03B948|nr:uncharacterized protein LOC124457709 [Xenia sp. Carnegie-2017]
MGLRCMSLRSFFRHQNTKLFPSIHLYWKKYKDSLNTNLRKIQDIVLAGDGRHESMGHCAKHCAYSIFCCNGDINKIVDFCLVQRNEAGNSPAMEYLAFTKALERL